MYLRAATLSWWVRCCGSELLPSPRGHSSLAWASKMYTIRKEAFPWCLKKSSRRPPFSTETCNTNLLIHAQHIVNTFNQTKRVSCGTLFGTMYRTRLRLLKLGTSDLLVCTNMRVPHYLRRYKDIQIDVARDQFLKRETCIMGLCLPINACIM